MAVVVAYGMAQEDQTSLHPFFLTVSNRSRKISNTHGTSHPLASDVDGSNEEDTQSHNVEPKSGELHEGVQRKNSHERDSRTETARAVEKTATAVPASASASSPSIQQTSWDPDPNHRRRKKRKTESPLREQVNRHQTESTHVPGGPSWHQQLIEAARETSPPDSVPAGIISTNDQADIKPSPLQLRRSPRMGKQDKSVETLQISSSDPFSSAQRQPGNITPRKRILKLNTDGKLVTPYIKNSASKQLATRNGTSMHVKHGKLVPTLVVIMKYGQDEARRWAISARIDEIMRQDPKCKQIGAVPLIPPRATHPFFLNKGGQKNLSSHPAVSENSSTKGEESDRDDELGLLTKNRPRWDDLVFTSKRKPQPTNAHVSDAIWPPAELQHVGREQSLDGTLPIRLVPSKCKQKYIDIGAEENVLLAFKSSLRGAGRVDKPLKAPDREVFSVERLQSVLKSKLPIDSPVRKYSQTFEYESLMWLYESIGRYLSHFDLGEIEPGIDWTTKYAPQCAAHVLQPDCIRLRDWLASLSIRTVKKSAIRSRGLEKSRQKAHSRRKTKNSDDLDDFIVSSDDDTVDGALSKNAILISGPSGCGKTAAVFAVARELNFEVFEIHPGMRRSLKDIFDKVGDMTQNHLVKQNRSSLETKSGESELNLPKYQSSASEGVMKDFFPRKHKNSSSSTSNQKLNPGSGASTTTQHIQNESLVLFEEVDILFEEDKSFWSGVITLIEQSKRPVILTCNDIRDVPIEELPLHAILEFDSAPTEVVSVYLTLLAAREGHLIDQEAATTLYDCIGQDLRAAITTMQFWCQLTVGSEQAGLDWMLDQHDIAANSSDVTRLRVVSKETYRRGLGLLAISELKDPIERHVELVENAQKDWDIPVSSWFETTFDKVNDLKIENEPIKKRRLDILDSLEHYSDSLSLLDLASRDIQASMSSAITTAYFPNGRSICPKELVQARLNQFQRKGLSMNDLVAALEPLKVERPVFPPATGRLAPSVDGASSIVPLDIAPYVRSIVAFDQQLEKLRHGLAGGSQGKKERTTRAARAALEGGSKGTTRRERWFPSTLDFGRLLRTGGEWPRGYPTGVNILTQSEEASPTPLDENQEAEMSEDMRLD